MPNMQPDDSKPVLLDADDAVGNMSPARGSFAGPDLSASQVGAFPIALLVLNAIPGLGFKAIRRLVEAFDGDLTAIWQVDAGKLRNILRPAQLPDLDSVVTSIQKDFAYHHQFAVTQYEELIDTNISILPGAVLPASLRELSDPPRWLFVEGDPRALYQKPAIALVGTRQATPTGLRATAQVVEMISAYDIVIVSGLADGIDAEAHSCSLGVGLTNVAFLGHGINLMLPAANKVLRERIVNQGGAVASEYLPGDRYLKQNLVHRNRLQSALADLVIPIEAAVQSGTAHTVRFAQQYSRPIAGISWPGVNGISETLSSNGYPVFDLSETADRNRFDGMLQALVAQDCGSEQP